ncbi:hypothetical protein HELRODRAFT_190381 [Helobdella robusta]|uniref:CUB domain-containing protein n=1 Tax=Helobdella robusta TaxID=6412 RepID=T1FRY1_HELRO|nr:hypothetical protein HELRODRAFT_190381 [Helobdella robusta]ESO10114.1 hypothetical protein HELRODRAFT_190381 [Helobdella robusta]
MAGIRFATNTNDFLINFNKLDNNYKITIQLSPFSLLDSNQAKLGILEIRNGASGKSPVMFRESKLVDFLMKNTSGNEARIRFVLFNTSTPTNVQAINIVVTIQFPTCNAEYHSQTGIIQTSDWSNLSPLFERCNLIVKVQNGYHVILNFSDVFSLSLCNSTYDTLTIRSGKFFESYCRSPGTIILPENEAHISYTIGSPSRGFFLKFSSGCGANFSAESGVIYSPGYPENYINNLSCVYYINVEKIILIRYKNDEFFVPESRVQAIYNYNRYPTRTSLYGSGLLPPHYQDIYMRNWRWPQPYQVTYTNTCPKDYLLVQELSGGRSEKLCGVQNDENMNVLKFQGPLMLNFVSDASFNDKGFKIHYQSVGTLHLAFSIFYMHLHSFKCTFL